MKDSLLNKIAEKEELKLIKSHKLKGGDINSVYELETEQESLVIKLNSADYSEDMFDTEVKGLELLRNTETFKIPEIYHQGQAENYHYLIMEKIESGEKSDTFWKDFAVKLAKLHGNSSEHFGLDHDNYIGLLPQHNRSTSTSAAEFYIEKRLKPQFAIAKEKAYSFQYLDHILEKFKNLIPDEKPALIHGDLWRSNFLITPNGEPALIDPAVAYAPREMELAMMKLFGGFDQEVFSIYNEIYPLEPGWEERIEIWQLYYLLVHLNIFGFGYLAHVRQILQNYW